MAALCRHENSWLPEDEDKYTGLPLFTNTITRSDNMHILGIPSIYGCLLRSTEGPCSKSSCLSVRRHHCCQVYPFVIKIRKRFDSVIITLVLLNEFLCRETIFKKTQSAEHLVIFRGQLRGRQEGGNIVNPVTQCKKKGGFINVTTLS